MRKENQWVAWKKYVHRGIDLVDREIPRGAVLENRNGILCLPDGEPVCAIHSENGNAYFAANYDGHGIERGKLIYEISKARRRDTVGLHENRYNETEKEWIKAKWGHYLEEGGGFILKDEFYSAPIQIVREVADWLNVKMEEEVIRV